MLIRGQQLVTRTARERARARRVHRPQLECRDLETFLHHLRPRLASGDGGGGGGVVVGGGGGSGGGGCGGGGGGGCGGVGGGEGGGGGGLQSQRMGTPMSALAWWSWS